MRYSPRGFEEPTQAALQDLARLWRSKAGRDGLPLRRAFDVAELRFLLGRLMLIDMIEPGRYTIRLHGTSLVDRCRYDATGQDVASLPEPFDCLDIAGNCRRAIESRMPVVSWERDPKPFRRETFEALWMPTRNDGQVTALTIICAVVHHASIRRVIDPAVVRREIPSYPPRA